MNSVYVLTLAEELRLDHVYIVQDTCLLSSREGESGLMLFPSPTFCQPHSQRYHTPKVYSAKTSGTQDGEGVRGARNQRTGLMFGGANNKSVDLYAV